MGNYIPFILQLLIATLFSIGIVAVVFFLSPKLLNDEKWFDEEKHDLVRDEVINQGGLKYFPSAGLLTLVIVAIMFFYLYAMKVKEHGWDGLLAIVLFVLVLGFGFFYAIKKEKH